jgi:hypothetical protein
LTIPPRPITPDDGSEADEGIGSMNVDDYVMDKEIMKETCQYIRMCCTVKRVLKTELEAGMDWALAYSIVERQVERAKVKRMD